MVVAFEQEQRLLRVKGGYVPNLAVTLANAGVQNSLKRLISGIRRNGVLR